MESFRVVRLPVEECCRTIIKPETATEAETSLLFFVVCTSENLFFSVTTTRSRRPKKDDDSRLTSLCSERVLDEAMMHCIHNQYFYYICIVH